MRKRLLFGFVFVLGMGLFFSLYAFAAPPTCTVTTAADRGVGSLRACLTAATVGTTINFALTTFPPTSPVTITLAMTLPVIITDHLTIDGSDAWVVLDGSRMSKPGTGLRVNGADGVVIRGLQIVNFGRNGILLEYGASNAVIGGDRTLGKGPLGQGNLISHNAVHGLMIADDTTHNNRVLGNYIGTDLTGVRAWGNGDMGVLLALCTHNNVIGGVTPSTRNLISGNEGDGVQIENACTKQNIVIGNYIGVDHTGIHALGNQAQGITMLDAPANQIGGTKPGEANIISGNEAAGILIQGQDAANNLIMGNLIGTDAKGRQAVGNKFGVTIMVGGHANTIGGATAQARNLISGNRESGIALQEGAAHNIVVGNIIGLDSTGARALGNAMTGILFDSGAHDNRIGGGQLGEGNLISGNQKQGIQMQGIDVQGNRVQGNRIGTSINGKQAIGNGIGNGLLLRDGAQHNIIGGSNTGEGNLISGHAVNGIAIAAGCDYNQLLGNWIGVDASGRQALGNQIGINLEASYTVIGGATSGARNLISGNHFTGVRLYGANSIYNRIVGNYIGTNIQGTRAISNTIGVYLSDGAQQNWIGGAASGEGNLISGNSQYGILIANSPVLGVSPSISNTIQGNTIGADATGSAALGNQNGIGLGFSANNNLIGGSTAGARNLISGNRDVGISLIGGNDEIDSATSGNRIFGNYIGTDRQGLHTLSNQSGIMVGGRAHHNLIGGLTDGEGNVIGGNTSVGIWIGRHQASENVVQGNLIGLTADSKNALPNGTGVILTGGASQNRIGSNNIIAYQHGAGIAVFGARTQKNGLTQNTIFQNDEGSIVISPTLTFSPTMMSYDPISRTVTGQACVRCQVEIFASPDDTPGGVHYLGTVISDRQGNFALILAAAPPFPYLSATATERETTSPFSAVLDTRQGSAPHCTVSVAADSGPGTLRTCLQTATVGTTIDFAPTVFPPTSPVTITLAMTLPVIITDRVTIDGSNAWVVLDGSQLPHREGKAGLRIQRADGVTIRGLQIVNFPRSGIVVEQGAHNTRIGGDRSVGKGPLGQGNLLSRNGYHGLFIGDDTTYHTRVEGNYIGVDLAGSADWGNIQSGIVISNCAYGNIIGGDSPTTRNLISGNKIAGIQIQDACTTDNHIVGNDIGVDHTGVNALGNGLGIGILDAKRNQIGGSQTGEFNVISGNAGAGVLLQGETATDNRVISNVIGTEANGRQAIGNQSGVVIILGAQYNRIGGVTAQERNLISGNREDGVVLQSDVAHNVITGNYIGTDSSGQRAMGTATAGTQQGTLLAGNQQNGVTISACAHDNIIGGVAFAGGNLISSNLKHGIFLQNECTTRNQITGNFIGVTADGLRALGNQFGIIIWAAQNNRIGGAAPGEGNVISGNQNSGISLQNGAAYNQIAGNRIGADVRGQAAVSNGETGIAVSAGASNNLIGGTHTGERNLISGNPKAGVQLQDMDTQSNHVIGNYIGIDERGVVALCDSSVNLACVQSAGIRIIGGAHNNFIGGANIGEGNLISGNGLDGIAIHNSVGNQIQGNIIGPDASGARRLVNGQDIGIYLAGAQATSIGGSSAGARNLISGHKMYGVWIDDVKSNGNRVQGNYIGVDISGSKVLSNSTGITIRGQENLIGGPGAGNLISGNAQWGIVSGGEPVFTEQHSTGNQVQGNLIGTDATGKRALGNGTGIDLAWGAMNNLIGGDTPAERNLISGNREIGITIIGGDEQVLVETSGNQIQGNYIGPDSTGQHALGNRFGISIDGQANGNIIGGLAAGEGNVISGNSVLGVGLLRLASDNTILGNYIGVGADGVRPVPNGNGVTLINGASGNTIGISNTIAYNHNNGITLLGAHTLKNTVTQNAIYQNDKGQIIISPTLTLSPTLVAYDPIAQTVTGKACPRCQVELFASPMDQPGGFAYLGSTQADRRGNFVLHLAAAAPARYLTATATERGTTSPFSAPLAIKQ